jgi:O-antigen biosynthesis protein
LKFTAETWKNISGWMKKPLRISILVPVYNTEPAVLRRCLDSVLNQTYRNWELCVADDASTDRAVAVVLHEYRLKSPKIKVRFFSENAGIADTINRCAEMASGKYLGVLDHDDELDPNLLFEYVSLIERRPAADLVYCDEDKIDPAGNYCDHWFKSDWNPDLALSFNYVMHFALYRRALWKKLGGMRKAYEGSQDFDLLLRAAEWTTEIYHVPKILYHWRMDEKSIASGPEAKPHIFQKGLAALNEALKRRGIDGRATDAPETWKGVYQVRRKTDSSPSCSVIVHYSGYDAGLFRLLTSIVKNIPLGKGEIVICASLPSIRKIADEFDPWDTPLRWCATEECDTIPRALNAAAAEAEGDFLLFLTDSFELVDGDSFDCLLEQAQRAEVGAAGGKVYYENGLVEHGGVILGPFGGVGYAHRATPDTPGYAGLKHMIGNFSAVMGFGMMTRRQIFKEACGFDQKFRTAYWDVDYCLRLRDRGLLITYTPYARFIHHIPVPTIEEFISQPDADFLNARWRQIIERDPYFNPNFSRRLESFHYEIPA